MLRVVICVLAPLLSAVTLPAHANASEPVEVVRVGVYDDDPDYMFGRIEHIVVAPDETVLVADSQLETLRRFSARGDFMATLGRAGEGPGEYVQIRGMVALPDERIAILSSPRRLTFIDGLSGRYLSAVQAPSNLYTNEQTLTYDGAGNLYVLGVAESTLNDEEPQMQWIKINDDGDVLDRIPVPKNDFTGQPMALAWPDGMRTSFAECTLSAWSPHGYLVVGRNNDYSFKLLHPTGVVEVRRDLDAVHLTSEEKDEWEARAERWETSFGRRFDIPDVKPAYMSLNVDHRGRIWVQRYVEAVERKYIDDEGKPYNVWLEPNAYDIFDHQGAYLGEVTLPDRSRMLGCHEDRIWGAVRTDEGENLVCWVSDVLQ